MEELKIGDIKRFKKGHKDIIGVVIAVKDTFYDVYDTQGWVQRFSKDSEYSSVKLESELRKSLTEVGFHAMKITQLEEEYREIQKKLEFHYKKFEESKAKVTKESKRKDKNKSKNWSNFYINLVAQLC